MITYAPTLPPICLTTLRAVSLDSRFFHVLFICKPDTLLLLIITLMELSKYSLARLAFIVH
jgi:hypothetical protein